MKTGMKRMRNAKIPASLILLAGGKGSRMGGNKLYLSRDGFPLVKNLLDRLAHLFQEVVLSVGTGESGYATDVLAPLIAAFQIIVTEDRASGRGPLEGLFNSLTAAGSEWGFLYACDMPSPQEAVIRTLWACTPPRCDVSAVRLNGRLSALHAFYRRSCLKTIDGAISDALNSRRGGAKIISFYDKIELNVVGEASFAHLPGWKKSFGNFNTPEELRDIYSALDDNL